MVTIDTELIAFAGIVLGLLIVESTLFITAVDKKHPIWWWIGLHALVILLANVVVGLNPALLSAMSQTIATAKHSLNAPVTIAGITLGVLLLEGIMAALARTTRHPLWSWIGLNALVASISVVINYNAGMLVAIGRSFNQQEIITGIIILVLLVVEVGIILVAAREDRPVRWWIGLNVVVAIPFLLGQIVRDEGAGGTKSCLNTLKDAIAEELITASLTGQGLSSGDSMSLTVENRTDDNLNVAAPSSGTILVSNNPDAQNMILQRVQSVVNEAEDSLIFQCLELTPSQVVTYVVRAFCLEFDKRNPGPEDSFTVGDQASGELQQVFSTLSRTPGESPSVAAIQAAVWAITDNVSREELRERFTATEDDVLASRALLERAGISLSNKRLYS